MAVCISVVGADYVINYCPEKDMTIADVMLNFLHARSKQDNYTVYVVIYTE